MFTRDPRKGTCHNNAVQCRTTMRLRRAYVGGLTLLKPATYTVFKQTQVPFL